VRVSIAAIATAAALAFPLAVRLPVELRYHAQSYHGHPAEALAGANAAGVPPRALIFVDGPDFTHSSFFRANALDPAKGDRIYVRDIP
jgi:hypothetical protein